jgi:hypothetical protein
MLSSRMAGPVAGVLLMGAAAGTASFERSRWRRAWQYAALGLSTLAPSALGWALLPETLPLPWLHRSVVLMVSTTLMTLLTAFVWHNRRVWFSRPGGLNPILQQAGDWSEAAGRSTPVLAVVALASLAAVLGQEWYHFEPFVGVPMAPAAKAAATAALGGLTLGCLAFAVFPQFDPLRLSDRGRTAYVYAAEALIVVLCFHLRWIVPDLFRHEIMRRYWMLILMGSAFAGAGLSEIFQRRRMPVLSEPLSRTAVLLPLLPAAAFYFVPDIADRWKLAGASPAVWFLGGLFYGILAVTRRKARFAAAAALAMNVGLWVLWHRLDFGFADRPQLFLIPIGLCILLAEYLNHDRLQAGQSAVLRYLALTIIYVSSSAEYLRAIGESVWLPLVLIVLSLLGVLAGVLMRVRSFLIMGVFFLLLVLATMVKYAYHVDQAWVLWLCCIALGAATIAAVGLYERQRDRVRAAIREFRSWER